MQQQAILVGVDGGGTNCRVRAALADGTPLGEARGGTGNIYTAPDAARQNILMLIAEVLGNAGLATSDTRRCYVGLGLAGANVANVARRFMERPLPFAAFRLESDAVVACRGAFPDGNGGIAIIGTGTAYVAQTRAGFVLLGGWGMLVSDQGGGADLGRRALAAALLALEGIGPASDLTNTVASRFERDAGSIAEFTRTAAPADFGSLAPIVVDHAESGDPVAIALAREGAASIETALLRLRELGADKLALLGGLSARYGRWLSADIRSCLVPARGDALDGALVLARDVFMSASTTKS